MGYRVFLAEKHQFEAPSWRPDERLRRVVELPRLRHSQSNLWRYSPGAQGRRHSEPVQEEVFCVLSGLLTIYLGDPPERFELPAASVVVVEANTPVQLRNESGADVVFFAYGAPAQGPDYVVDVLPEMVSSDARCD